MIAFFRNLLSAKANQAAGLAAQKGGKVTFFSLLLGVAMSHQRPLLQEDEDNGRDGDKNGQDSHDGQVK